MLLFLYWLLIEDECPGCCEEAFTTTYPSADCIVYNDADCDNMGLGDKWAMPLKSGQSETFANLTKYSNDIESISVRQGCRIKIWTGN